MEMPVTSRYWFVYDARPLSRIFYSISAG